MAFTRWDPFHDLLAMQRQLDRCTPGPAGWMPAVDLHEAPDRYVIVAELPGLRRDDVQIHYHEGRLTLSGTRRERAAPYEQYHRIERGHGAFSRTFELPVPVRADDIRAELVNGILTVTVPKSPEATPRRIRVS